MRFCVILCALAFQVLPFVAFAGSDSCECWCGTSTEGALRIGDTFANANACVAACKNRGKDFVTCVGQTEGTAPYANLRCWSSEECTAKGGTFSPDQPKECLSGFHFCLPSDVPIPLAVPLGAVSSVRGAGGYIASAYTYLIGAGAVFAIIMVIIGGVQYMIGGASGDVKTARSRITNALVGFGLLLGSFFLLKTVNPQLVRLQLPQLPKMRPVVLPDGSETCEAYYEAGYTLELSDGKVTNKNDSDALHIATAQCGTSAELEKNPQGNEMNRTIACYYTTLCEAGKICQVDKEAEGQTAGEGCKTCEQLSNAGTLYPKPSANACGGFTASYDNSGSQRQGCFYFKGQNLCGRVNAGCANIHACDDYQTATVSMTGYGSISILQSVVMSYQNVSAYQEFCARDFCGVGPCAIVPSSLGGVGQCKKK